MGSWGDGYRIVSFENRLSCAANCHCHTFSVDEAPLEPSPVMYRFLKPRCRRGSLRILSLKDLYHIAWLSPGHYLFIIIYTQSRGCQFVSED